MRKITFDLVSSDDGFDESGKWPIALGEMSSFSVDIEFEPTGDDVMRDAENALTLYMQKKHPKMEYKISYWWWK